ncbi:MAG: hypothetical protein JO299_02080 [Gammaproteobacteria bacterium]|nr:hypothetical protein [Gammaproteobacteria bacterium]
MKREDFPPAVRQHPELANLLGYVENKPDAQKALMEFFNACERLTRAELAEIFAYGELILRGH